MTELSPLMLSDCRDAQSQLGDRKGNNASRNRHGFYEASLALCPAYQREVKSVRYIKNLSTSTAEKITICSLNSPRMIASAARAQFLLSTAE
jgi:hypothetical protein